MSTHIDLDEVEATPDACGPHTRHALVAAARALIALADREGLDRFEPGTLVEPWASALEATLPFRAEEVARWATYRTPSARTSASSWPDPTPTTTTLAADGLDLVLSEIEHEIRVCSCEDPQEIAALYMACHLSAYRLNTIRTHLAEMYQAAV